MDSTRVIELLAGTALAEGLEPEDVRRLAESGELRQAAAGEVLLEQGDEGAPLMVVLEGEVEVLMTDEEGRHHCLLNLSEASVLGEIGLILDRPVTATVRTRRPTILFVIERGRFQDLLAHGRTAATALTLALAKILAARLQRMNEEAVELCERYEKLLAESGDPQKNARVAELARFKQQLLSEWNF